MTSLWVSLATSAIVLAGPAAVLVLLASYAIVVAGLRALKSGRVVLGRACGSLQKWLAASHKIDLTSAKVS